MWLMALIVYNSSLVFSSCRLELVIHQHNKQIIDYFPTGIQFWSTVNNCHSLVHDMSKIKCHFLMYMYRTNLKILLQSVSILRFFYPQSLFFLLPKKNFLFSFFLKETKECHFLSHKRGDLICSQEVRKKTVSILLLEQHKNWQNKQAFCRIEFMAQFSDYFLHTKNLDA